MIVQPPEDALIIRGDGPCVVLVHGSGTDASTWSIQLARVTGLRLIAYHRRGTPAWPDSGEPSTADHARDLASIIEAHGDGCAMVCGSSFGGVIALQLAKDRPELISKAMLCEPPLAPTSSGPAVPVSFVRQFDHLQDTRGGPAAAEFFLRTVLGEGVFEGLPGRWQERSKALWRQIRSDVHALSASDLSDDDLAEIDVPILLLAGERSVRYRRTAERLASALPRATLEVISAAGHMMHAEAVRAFNRRLQTWALSGS